ncbi:conserved hypothetical protein [Gluconacetobacter diazotrophicus PA1 5]|uniref:Uncharacterized protein n=2 Tax=Gluconacetobacter diazotrophicus TaxID=33996 RepID=A9HSD1_GLUDA|nr:hypothetical protein [Gluconacetobacter diazotrophicus]ACI52978.1 conserved hypothetical protein [Gluconacetobacter diazotrophicus PA1 5]MBB2157672.1 hypothetical protein [Gluconacetobacter diazotrophicus]TWA98155.1 hypothetical protein FBZ86_1547 [Gluconacetobacter diazotrophicus]CAP57061.1 conserved hypothetical protein [Gluconacetobacter diazotrophicus PA1 5]
MSAYNESFPFSGETEHADIENRDEVSEDALRQALARLGSKPAGSSAPSPSAPRNARAFDPAQRRRKFVQDGDVRVEHHALARPASARTLHAPQDDGGEVERLRHQMRHEQKLREDAERACHDAQSSLRSMETRIGHADIELAEAQAGLASRDEEILALRSSLAAARADIARLEQDLARSMREASAPRPPAPVRATAPRRPRRTAAPPVVEDEPEPVKWWIKKK